MLSKLSSWWGNAHPSMLYKGLEPSTLCLLDVGTISPTRSIPESWESISLLLRAFTRRSSLRDCEIVNECEFLPIEIKWTYCELRINRTTMRTIIAIMKTMAMMKRIRKISSEVFCSVGRGPTEINTKSSSSQRLMSSFSVAGFDFRLSLECRHYFLFLSKLIYGIYVIISLARTGVFDVWLMKWLTAE